MLYNLYEYIDLEVVNNSFYYPSIAVSDFIMTIIYLYVSTISLIGLYLSLFNVSVKIS